MRTVTVKMKIVVPSATVHNWHLDLLKRMHKYLSKYAAKVTDISMEVNDGKES